MMHGQANIKLINDSQVLSDFVHVAWDCASLKALKYFTVKGVRKIQSTELQNLYNF